MHLYALSDMDWTNEEIKRHPLPSSVSSLCPVDAGKPVDENLPAIRLASQMQFPHYQGVKLHLYLELKVKVEFKSIVVTR